MARLHAAFASDYQKRSVSEQAAFAARLLETADEENNDPVLRYVLLHEAAQVAAKAGAIKTVLNATQSITDGYHVDAIAKWRGILDTTARRIRSSEDAAAFVDACDQASRHALVALDSRSHNAFVRLAQGGLRRVSSRDDAAPLLRQFEVMRANGRLLTKVEQARRTLERTPDNADANRTVGLFYTLVVKDQTTGAAYLAKAGGPALETITAAHNDPNHDDPMALGKAWGIVSDEEDGVFQTEAAKLAIRLLERALPDASGIDKLEADALMKRMYQAAGLPAGYAKLTEQERSELLRVGDKYFLLVLKHMTNEEARAYAAERDATLACIGNSQENRVLTRTLVQQTPVRNHRGFWTGASDVDREGRWVWQDGSPFRYANWSAKQPDNAHGQEDHMEVFRSGKWNDRPGSHRRVFFIQWDIGS